MGFCPTDGEVLEDDPSALVDTVLDGQYQVEALLGKGGMGAVYRARHILLGDRVAIKILPPEVRTNAEWLRRFQREGQAARRFRHPNAVTVYDLRTAPDGYVYMVMEYVEGHTLGDEIKKRGRLAPAEVVELLEPIMSVLNTAHAMGVVHRDLKPDNIMIGQSNNGERVIKLLDLGIAKMREIAGGDGGKTALTMAGQVLGTPHYMSPEQWGELPRDGDSEIDGRADIYSLGIVCYEMIVGKRPYSGQTLFELRREHISVVPPPVYETVPGVPRAFGDAITQATAKDRSDRFATAGDFAARLRTAVSSADSVVFDRTLPDLPRAAESDAHTADISSPSVTNSDVNAETILTLDSPATSPLDRAAHTAHQGPPGNERPAGFAAVSSAGPPSEITVAQQRPKFEFQVPSASVPKAAPQAAPSKSKSLGLILGVVGLVVLLGLSVAGFFAVKKFTANPGNGTENNTSLTNSGTTGTSRTAATTEVAQYWLELFPESLLGESTRVAGAVPLASEQAFKFHFEFKESGYLYIVGPGEKNKPTAFLTAKPARISGLDTNQVAKGVDFSFPSGLEHWLKLDKKAGTEDYTIIFSPSPLTEPPFFTGAATGNPLSETEEAELTSFLAKHKNADPVIEINDKDASQPFAAVKAARSDGATTPIVFRIRIQHK